MARSGLALVMESPGPNFDVQADRRLADVCALELHLMDPAVRRDRAAVDRLLPPDFLETGASGRVWDKASVLDLLADDPGTPPAVSNVQAHSLTADAVLVTYRAQTSGAVASLRASIWLRDAEGWRIRFHQGTPAGFEKRAVARVRRAGCDVHRAHVALSWPT